MMDDESDIVVTNGSVAMRNKLKVSKSSSTTLSSIIEAFLQMELSEYIP